eukprot:9170-Heterococcus_DN1.PRE.2
MLTHCDLFVTRQQSIDTGLEPIAETAAPYVNNTYNTPAKTFEHLYHHYHHFEARGTADSKDLDIEEPALTSSIINKYSHAHSCYAYTLARVSAISQYYDELGFLLPEPSPPLCSTFNLSPVHLLLTLCIVGSTAAAAVAISCNTAVSGGVLHVWTVCGSTVGLLIGYTLPAALHLMVKFCRKFPRARKFSSSSGESHYTATSSPQNDDVTTGSFSEGPASRRGSIDLGARFRSKQLQFSNSVVDTGIVTAASTTAAAMAATTGTAATAATAGGGSTGNFAQSLLGVRQERSDTGNSSIASASALTSVPSGLCSVDEYGELSEQNLALNNRLSLTYGSLQETAVPGDFDEMKQARAPGTAAVVAAVRPSIAVKDVACVVLIAVSLACIAVLSMSNFAFLYSL